MTRGYDLLLWTQTLWEQMPGSFLLRDQLRPFGERSCFSFR